MKRRLKSVDIVVPIYNEEIELEDSIKKLHGYLRKNLNKKYGFKIIIADNASRDNSLKISKKLSSKISEVDFVHLNEKGRGRAVKKVWMKSKSDFFYMDVDLSTDLGAILPVIDSLDSGYDIAIGSRLSKGSKVYGRTVKREIMSRVYNLMIKFFFSSKITDAQCGFKCIRSDAAKKILPYVKDNEWFFDTELLIIAEKLNYKIFQQPVKWIDNPGSTVRVLKTVSGDLKGLLRLFIFRPWNNKLYAK